MLNRRILRIKVFKQLYSYAVSPQLSLKEALRELDCSCEAVRDLYLFMLGLVPALTGEALRRIEAARGKFKPTEEDLHPNMKFASCAMAGILAEDPDFQKLSEKKKLSWEQYDVFVRRLFDQLRETDYYAQYMSSGKSSLTEDARLLTKLFEREIVDDQDLAKILEDLSIYWNDDLAYALTWCCHGVEDIARTGRWELPPLYQSDILVRKGATDVESDRKFAVSLLQCAYGKWDAYQSMIAGAVNKWDKDRLFTTDLVLIILGLAEAEHFPSIPVRATINEYVEISKYYGTPKSRSFVNGLMDKLIKQLAEEGRINKDITPTQYPQT